MRQPRAVYSRAMPRPAKSPDEGSFIDGFPFLNCPFEIRQRGIRSLCGRKICQHLRRKRPFTTRGPTRRNRTPALRRRGRNDRSTVPGAGFSARTAARARRAVPLSPPVGASPSPAPRPFPDPPFPRSRSPPAKIPAPVSAAPAPHRPPVSHPASALFCRSYSQTPFGESYIFVNISLEAGGVSWYITKTQRREFHAAGQRHHEGL